MSNEYKLEEYKELLKEYSGLESDNFNHAYRIMKKATALADFYGEWLARQVKDSIKSEFDYKQTKAKMSTTLAPNKVAEGERLALASNEVKSAHTCYAENLYIQKTLENITSTIEKIYFDSKNIWDKGNKEYRSKER